MVYDPKWMLIFLIVLFVGCGQSESGKAPSSETAGVKQESNAEIAVNPTAKLESTPKPQRKYRTVDEIRALDATKYYDKMVAIAAREVDADTLNQLLFEEKFDELEAFIRSIEEKFFDDPAYEMAYLISFGAFNGSDASHLAKLNRWIMRKPSSIAYCARGTYKFSRGFHFRGGKYANETPEDNFRKMHEMHQGAIQDLNTAIKRNEKCLPAYCNLMETYMASSGKGQIKEVHNKGVGVFPGSFYIRNYYLHTMTPRWGGSYEEMYDYIKKLDEVVKLNPAIWILKGRIFVDQGELIFGQKRNDDAIYLMSEALKFGVDKDALKIRAFAFYQMFQYEDALKDFDEFLKYEPNDEQCNYFRIICLAYADHYEEVYPILKEMVKIAPGEKQLHDALQYVEENMGNQKETDAKTKP